MDRFHELSVFVAVAEEAGFAAGARRLRLSPPAVTRAVAALEERLGVRLLARTTRQVRLTEAGRRYLEDARRILAEVQAADDAAAGINAAPRGAIAVTAPVLFGRMFVVPRIVEYLERFPDTQVAAHLLDRVVNLLDEGIDVAVRIGALPDSSLHARRVGSVRVVVVAAPAYLARHDAPRAPEDLLAHTLIASSAGAGAVDWRFEDGGGAARALRVHPRLTVNTNDAAIEAALEGFGITRLLSYQVAEHVRNGDLDVVLERHESPARPIHVVYRETRYGAARTRAFVDLLVDGLRADPALA